MLGYYIFGIGRNPETKSLFSETQFRNNLPPSLGGIHRLNLDNIGTLQLCAPYNENSVTLRLNVVPVEELPVKNHGFRAEGIQSYYYDKSQEYFFDTANNKSKEILIHGRVFIVTIKKIRKLKIENVAKPLEYEFGVSER